MEENKSYPVILIGIVVLVFYLATYILSRAGLFRKVVHRKFWNILLLVSFSVCGVLGIFLTFQVNYKWKIPYLEEITELHVDFGISLFIIAFFHIFWHLNYFRKLIRAGFDSHESESSGEIVAARKPEKKYADLTSPRNFKPESHGVLFFLRKKFFYPVLILGFSTACVQIILLREFLSVFYGNEMIVGIILANWMLLCGLGAWLGRSSGRIKNKSSFLAVLHVLLAVLPVITLFLLAFLRNIIFPPGCMADLFQVWFFSFLLLFPFCIVSGLAFTVFSVMLSEKYSSDFISAVYSLEAAGSLIGGLLLNLCLIYFLKPFQDLYLLLLINFLASVFLCFKNQSKISRYIIPFSVLCALVYPFTDLDSVTKKLLYRDQEVTFSKDTPFGNLVVTRNGEQTNFFENGLLLFSSGNISSNEEAVHFAMVQHPAPEDVLLISGGISGMFAELFKYPVKRVDYVESNPWLVETAKKFVIQKIPEEVNLVSLDARMFVKSTDHSYDVVLINLPEPSTTGINRYYTNEFFLALKRVMKPGSILSTQLPSTVNYLSEEAKKINAVLYNTLNKNFLNVLIIPGETNHFLASDSALSPRVVEKLELKNIPSEYVRYYLIDEQIQERSEYIMENIKGYNIINKDFEPISSFLQFDYWMSQFRTNYWILIMVAALILGMIMLRFDSLSFGLFAGGFAGSSIEIVLVFGYQVIYGFVYQMLGILIAVFMAGLAAGSLWGNRLFPLASNRRFAFLLFVLAMAVLICPVALEFLNRGEQNIFLAHSVFFVILFLAGIITGTLFSVACCLRKGSIASASGVNYSADLVGAAIGAIVFAALLIPAKGIWFSCFFTVFFTLVVALINFVIGLKNKK